MLRQCAAALAFSVLAPALALAQDDPMAGYYGNTVISTGSLGESHTHYKPDHTFDVTLSALGQTFTGKGTWKIDEKGQLCRTYDRPPPGLTNPVCTEVHPHKPGDKWTVTLNGQSRDVTMKAGEQ